MEFKARGGKIIAVVVEDDKRITSISHQTIRIPQPSNKYYNIFSPITFIPALTNLVWIAPTTSLSILGYGQEVKNDS